MHSTIARGAAGSRASTLATAIGGSAALALCALLLAATSAWAIPEGPDPGTPEWEQREAQNYARTSEAPSEQANPTFQNAWNMQGLANQQEWANRALADPSWVGPPSGNSELTPVSATWGSLAVGDPTRYAAYAGANGAPFYENEADVAPVVFYDAGCARISGRVWAPHGWHTGDALLPGVVVENGSIQATEPLYWWFTQALVRDGYVVITFDPRGQGRSDQQTPSGEQGGNVNSDVFFSGLVNVIDFFRSSPTRLYPHNVTCAGTYPTEVAPYNPFFDRLDLNRLGITGHSLGASGVSAVQGYPGDRFAFPDDDGRNPVDVVIAWDKLGLSADGPPRVPAMGEASEYGLTPMPFTQEPDPEGHKTPYAAYRDAGIPVYQFTIQGSTHYEWSSVPSFPTTSWCPDISSGGCTGGWGRPMGEHYSVAWMDRWLKKPGEPGYGDADARLLADADWCDRYSFYFRSARAFPDRKGKGHHTEDVRADCLAGVVDTPADCAVTPVAACHGTTQPRSSSITIKDATPDSGDQIKWSWRKGAATSVAELGDPVNGDTSYTLCLYDDSGGTPSVVTTATVAPGGTCGGKPCWSATASGLKYSDPTLAQQGTRTIKLMSGATGRSRISWLGKGANLGFSAVEPLLLLDQSPKMTVQLTNSDGFCWTADYSAPATANQSEKFTDKSD